LGDGQFACLIQFVRLITPLAHDPLQLSQRGPSVAGLLPHLAHRFLPRCDPDHNCTPNQIFCDARHISWNFSVAWWQVSEPHRPREQE